MHNLKHNDSYKYIEWLIRSHENRTEDLENKLDEMFGIDQIFLSAFISFILTFPLTFFSDLLKPEKGILFNLGYFFAILLVLFVATLIIIRCFLPWILKKFKKYKLSEYKQDRVLQDFKDIVVNKIILMSNLVSNIEDGSDGKIKKLYMIEMLDDCSSVIAFLSTNLLENNSNIIKSHYCEDNDISEIYKHISIQTLLHILSMIEEIIEYLDRFITNEMEAVYKCELRLIKKGYKEMQKKISGLTYCDDCQGRGGSRGP